jgi:hypothetical protein
MQHTADSQAALTRKQQEEEVHASVIQIILHHSRLVHISALTACGAHSQFHKHVSGGKHVRVRVWLTGSHPCFAPATPTDLLQPETHHQRLTLRCISTLETCSCHLLAHTLEQQSAH